MRSATRRHPVLAFVALGLALAIFLIPLHFGGRDTLALTTALVQAANGDSHTLNAPIILSERPRVVLERGTVAIESGDKSAGLAALLKLLIDGRARLVIDNAVLSFDTAEIASDAAGTVAPSAGPAEHPILAALAGLNFEALTIHQATLVRQSAAGAKSELGTISADVTLKARSIASAQGTFVRNGQTVAFDATLALPKGAKANARLPFRVGLKGLLLAADFSGHLVRGRTVQIVASQSDIRTPDLKQLAEWLGAGSIASPGFDEFSAKGPFEWADGTLEFQPAQVVIDGNAASGSLSVQFGGERPSVEGTLDFANLELGSYVWDHRSNGIFALGAAWLPSIASEDSATSLIEAIDADLRISAGRVSLRAAQVGHGAATLTVKRGRLNANITDIELEQGGSGEGQIAIDMRGSVPRYDIRGELRDVHAGEVSRALLGRTAIDGTATLSGHVTATGTTSRDMLSSLDGRIGLAVPNGAILGLDLEALLAMPKTPGAKGWGSALSRTTAANALTLRVMSANGVLSTETAELATGAGQFTAAGTIDLRARALDVMLSRVWPADTAASEPQAVRIHGPLDKPEITATPNSNRADAAHRPQPPG